MHQPVPATLRGRLGNEKRHGRWTIGERGACGNSIRVLCESLPFLQVLRIVERTKDPPPQGQRLQPNQSFQIHFFHMVKPTKRGTTKPKKNMTKKSVGSVKSIKTKGNEQNQPSIGKKETPGGYKMIKCKGKSIIKDTPEVNSDDSEDIEEDDIEDSDNEENYREMEDNEDDEEFDSDHSSEFLDSGDEEEEHNDSDDDDDGFEDQGSDSEEEKSGEEEGEGRGRGRRIEGKAASCLIMFYTIS